MRAEHAQGFWRAPKLAVAFSLASVVSLAAASTAPADPNDVSTRCESGYSGYCRQLWNDGGQQHWRLYWFEGPDYFGARISSDDVDPGDDMGLL
jgi:hypothetical protein